MTTGAPRASIVRIAVGVALVANLGAALAPSATRTGLLADLRFIATHPGLSYHEKMALKYPDVYRGVPFVLEHTDPQATVLIPVAMWQGALTTYLLFPRRIDTHREGFLWGGTPRGSLALVDGRWPEDFGDDVRRSSRLVARGQGMALIERIQ